MSALKLVIHWPRFGPYHLARLQAAHVYFQRQGAQIVALETAGQDNTYLWRTSTDALPFDRITLAPYEVAENLSRRQVWSKLTSVLSHIQPNVIAINGYGAPDSQMLLLWSWLHRTPAILMSESKFDDAPRSLFREGLKRFLVGHYAAALCGGAPHRVYLEQLGMKSKRIYAGYDVVDNGFFRQAAQQVRTNPRAYRLLAGLEHETPYFLASSRFVARKNLLGLLQAYLLYCAQSQEKKVQPWRLVILGDGEERVILERFIAQHQVAGVTLPGFCQIEQLPAYYGLASAFIHPATQEQWGLVVNEAMASGLPVLVSERCGCAADLVRPGLNGYTFNPDSLSTMAELMLRCTTGEFDLAAMGQASQQVIAHWDLLRFAEEMWRAVQVSVGTP